MSLTTLAPGTVIRHALVQLDDFLPADELAWLSDRVFAAEKLFVPSGVSDSKEDYRHSFVLNPPDDLTRKIVGRIRAVMPEVIPRLRMAPFPARVTSSGSVERRNNTDPR